VDLNESSPHTKDEGNFGVHPDESEDSGSPEEGENKGVLSFFF